MTIENGFKICLTKTHVMHFIPPKLGYIQRNSNPDPFLMLGEHKIEVVKEKKVLRIDMGLQIKF